MNLVDFDYIRQYDDDVIISIIYENACKSGLIILAKVIILYWESQEEAEEASNDNT